MKKILTGLLLVWAAFSAHAAVQENFDGWSDSSYGTVSTYTNANGGQWETYNSMTHSDNARSGNAVRFNDDSSENEYLLYKGLDGNGKDDGIGSVSFWYRHWNGDGSGVQFQVQYQPSGGSWTDIGSVVSVSSTTYAEFSQTVNVTGDDILFRVISIDDAERLLIDDLTITDYTGGSVNPVADIEITSPLDGAEYANNVSNITVSGTATNMTGDLVWTNEATAAGGIIAYTGSWTVASIDLAEGANTISISGTNTTGGADTDSITVTRLLPVAPSVTNSFGWENGATVLGSSGNLADPMNVASNGAVMPHGGSTMLQVTENPLGDTPAAYVAYIENLNEGDEVTVSFYGYDVTPGVFPSLRIWGHYATNGDVTSDTGTAGGNSSYTAGTGWDQISHTWTIPAGQEALVVEARLYSGASGTETNYWIDDIEVIMPETAMVTFPEPETADLQITEIWPGQDGTDLTEDWFEIVNNGTAAWVSGVDADLYYDDESADPADAVQIMGISDIQPGEAIVVAVGSASATSDVYTVWSPVIEMDGVQVGYADGSGLGGGGDAVTLWLGDPNAAGVLADFEAYPDTAGYNALSYDVVNAAFSVAGTNGAVTTMALGGSDTPAVGSPGNGAEIVALTPSLAITSPTNGAAYAYDTAILAVRVTAANIEGGVSFINETLNTTQTVAGASAFVSLAEGINTLTVSGTNAQGQVASDTVSVTRGTGSGNHVALAAIGSIELAAGSEIVAFDAGTQTAFVTTPNSGLVMVDVSNPAAPVQIGSVLTNELINSVAVYNGLVAVAVESGTNTAGQVVFLDAATGLETNRVTVGIQPDNVVFSPNGQMVLTADEAETGDHADYGNGSISVIDLSAGVASASVTVLDFTAFDSQTNALKAAGVRLFPGRLPSQDFEPEYVAVSPDSTQAFVTLQEANAMAVVDLTVPSITKIVPLGLKDWNDPANTLDASDEDGGIYMDNYPFYGMFMPDTVVSYAVNGKTYYVIANEGDSRDFGGIDEERLSKVTLDPTVFPDTSFQAKSIAGRMKISLINADTNGDGKLDVIYGYGGRSFSILDADGAMVYDSADDFESYLATERPELFNINDSDPAEFDKRSDDKGCEPEAAEVGVINGVTYAFIGLERVGGIMVYNVSNPENPAFVEFVRLASDAAPEGFDFVAAEDSPSGKPLLLVANEGSNTLTIYELAVNASATTLKGTPIEWLASYGLTEADENLDADDDGLTVAQEYALGLNPLKADTDGDLLPDGYEVASNMDASTAATILTDSDGDGQSDIMEYNYGTAADSISDFFTTGTDAESGMFQLSFDAAEGHQYVIQESDEMGTTWHNGVVVDGSNGMVTVEYPATENSRFFHVDGAVNKGAPVAKICVISDLHYFATNLLDDVSNPYFQLYLAHDRKLVAESHVILESAVASIIEEQPDVLLVPGDLTKDGEVASHQAVSNFFAQVEAAGISVVVCPGNHDINNTHAVEYIGGTTNPVASITAGGFETNYAHCGFAEAISRDPASLSFVTEPVDGLWVMSIDSCLYTPTQITAGQVSAATLSWMEQVMADGAASNKTVIAMMHHGVVPHYAYQTALFAEYVVNNYAEVQQTLIDGGVGAVFTGHYHANDIVRDATGSLFDIQTGSTVTWPCPYRVIFMTADGVMNVGTKRIEDVDGFSDFQTYAQTYLNDGLLVVSKYMLMAPPYSLPEAQADALAPAMTASFMAHYAGDEGTPDPYTQAVMTGLLSSANPLEQLMGAAIQSIWDDPAPADNDVLLNTQTGGAAAK